jgi:hypothetical protein
MTKIHRMIVIPRDVQQAAMAKTGRSALIRWSGMMLCWNMIRPPAGHKPLPGLFQAKQPRHETGVGR